MTGSPLFILCVGVLIVLGGIRLWSMFKITAMIPQERRADILNRLQNEGNASGTDWDQVIGPGAAQLVRLNRSITQLGLYAAAAFVILILATTLLK